MKNLLAKAVAFATVVVPLTQAIGQTVTIQASDTLLDLGQKWVVAYKAKTPATSLQLTGGGATAALAALAEKKLDIALVSRSIRYKEAEACVAAFGQRPAEYKVAVNGVAVYVNTNNPVKVLNYDELLAIFSGQQTNWKEFDGGEDQPISVYVQTTNSVPGELFGEEVLGRKEMAGASRLLAEPELLKAIAGDPRGIGYGALAQVEGVRPLSIKRVFSSRPVVPGEDTLTNRVYPLSRFVFCYLNPAGNTNEARAYLDWVRSDEGQQIARAAGFFPIAAKWRSNP